LDLHEETFITDSELLNYFNEAMDMVEANVHSIYEDYFLTKTTLSVVSGTQAYSLPSDIYAQKIRRIIHDDGSDKYDVRQIRNLSEIPEVVSTDPLRYVMFNDATLGMQLTFYPTPAFTSSTRVTIYYIRNARKFTGVTSETCDLPEFSNVVVQYVKWRCMEKEGHPNTAEAANALDELKGLMVETLSNRVVDEDTKLQNDLSFYRDFDSYWITGGRS